jgi:glycosyltransferase involved in cell wall biosynthesis
MAQLAIVTSSPEAVEGGHLVIARALVTAARESGHQAHLVVTPECQFGRQASAYFQTWRTDVGNVAGQRIDQVISLRFPSYAVRHPSHVCWLNHTMREYYDQWPRFVAQLSPQGRVKERLKRVVIRAADRWLLTRNVTEVVAQSRTIQRRLAQDFDITADVLLPPPPPRAYRCDGYGDYVFAISRLTPLKRIDLFVRALADPAARGTRAVIAGDGQCGAELERLIVALGLSDRVTLTGSLSDKAVLDHFAQCRAVCFPPVGEDYGLVTAEAFASRKGVITCADSGGPTELVRHGETGLICDPTPKNLAEAIGQIMDDPGLAERLGNAAALRIAMLNWPATVKRLVIA